MPATVPGASAFVGIVEHRGTDLSKLIPYGSHHLPVALRGGLDSKGQQQRGRWLTRVSCFPKRGVQSLVSKVVKDQVNDAPGVESLGLLMAGFRHQAILFPHREQCQPRVGDPPEPSVTAQASNAG